MYNFYKNIPQIIDNFDVNEMPMGHNTFDPAWLQGGEL